MRHANCHEKNETSQSAQEPYGRHQAVHDVQEGGQGPRAQGHQVVRLPVDQQAEHGRAVGPGDAPGQVEGGSKNQKNLCRLRLKLSKFLQ